MFSRRPVHQLAIQDFLLSYKRKVIVSFLYILKPSFYMKCSPLQTELAKTVLLEEFADEALSSQKQKRVIVVY